MLQHFSARKVCKSSCSSSQNKASLDEALKRRK
jgi:hypothetical protein